jgi:hypothetical protein
VTQLLLTALAQCRIGLICMTMSVPVSVGVISTITKIASWMPTAAGSLVAAVAFAQTNWSPCSCQAQSGIRAWRGQGSGEVQLV